METLFYIFISIVWSLIAVAILYALWLLIIIQGRRISKFDIEEKLYERIAFYQKRQITNLLFIEQDLETFVYNKLDSDASMINLLIGSLSILGLLGTFVGLSGALKILPNVLEMKVEASGLTSSISHAFFTSIAGLLGALIINVLQNRFQKQIDNIVLKMRTRAFNILFANNSMKQMDLDSLAKSIESSFQTGIDLLLEHNENEYAKLEDFATKIIETSATNIFQMVDSNEAKLEAVIQKLEEERKSIDSVKKNWNRAIDQLHQSSVNIKSMTQNLNNFASLSEKLIDIMMEYAENFHSQIAVLRQMENQLNRPSDLMNNLTILMAESISQSNRAYEKYVENQEYTKEIVNGALNDASQLLEDIKTSIESSNDAFKLQLIAIEESSRKAQGNMQQQLKDSLQNTNEQMLENLSREISAISKHNANTIEKLAKEMSSITQDIRQANAQTTEAIKNASELLQKTIPGQESQLQKVNESFTSLDRKLKRAFEAIINRDN
ncbi:MAG: MotA/TolQ/ExbB proton channel family protein [Candidatus Cloacimonetes bacterium]|nr:MotA/TolQ/ExbB proton channel family protein [Candidatus Cloacimonadota bacterium]